MAYVGQEPNGSFTTNVSKDTFSGDGSTTAFTLTEGASTNTVDVFVENVRQEPTEAYSVDGTTLTFTEAPGTGTNNIYVVNKSPVRLQATHPAGLALEAHSATISTDLTVDTDLLFVDASGNAVGIGDATPESISNYNILSVGSSTSKRGVINASNGTAVASLWTTDANLARVGSRSDHDVSFERNGSEMWKLTSSGHLKAATNGYGIDFSASEGSGASSSVLDDYEEGTWTPTVATGTINSGSARYTKIGDLVHVTCNISNFSDRSTASNIRIGGLPFSSSSATNATSAVLGRYANVGGDAIVTFHSSSSTELFLYTTLKGGNYSTVNHNNLNSSSASFYISHTYKA